MSCRPPDPGRPAAAPQVRAVGISSTLASFPGAGGVAPGNEASTTMEHAYSVASLPRNFEIRARSARDIRDVCSQEKCGVHETRGALLSHVLHGEGRLQSTPKWRAQYLAVFYTYTAS